MNSLYFTSCFYPKKNKNVSLYFTSLYLNAPLMLTKSMLFKIQSNNANSTLFSSQLKNRRPSWTLHTLMHKITLHAFQKKTFMQQDFLTQKNPIFHACTQTLGRCTNDSNSTQLLGINHKIK